MHRAHINTRRAKSRATAIHLQQAETNVIHEGAFFIWYATRQEKKAQGYKLYEVYANRELASKIELIHQLRQLHGRTYTKSSTVKLLINLGFQEYKKDRRYQKLLNELQGGEPVQDEPNAKERAQDELQRLFCMLDSSDE